MKRLSSLTTLARLREATCWTAVLALVGGAFLGGIGSAARADDGLIKFVEPAAAPTATPQLPPVVTESSTASPARPAALMQGTPGQETPGQTSLIRMAPVQSALGQSPSTTSTTVRTIRDVAPVRQPKPAATAMPTSSSRGGLLSLLRSGGRLFPGRRPSEESEEKEEIEQATVIEQATAIEPAGVGPRMPLHLESGATAQQATVVEALPIPEPPPRAPQAASATRGKPQPPIAPHFPGTSPGGAGLRPQIQATTISPPSAPVLLTPADVRHALNPAKQPSPSASAGEKHATLSDRTSPRTSERPDARVIGPVMPDGVAGNIDNIPVRPASPASELLDYRLDSSVALVMLVQPTEAERLEKITTLEADAAGQRAEGLRPIGEVGADIRPDLGEVPSNIAAAQFANVGEIHQTMGASRDWGLYSFNWESKGLCHQPLRFEEVNLERHGYSLGVIQPAVSAVHFFSLMPAIPYLMASTPRRECIYTLGHYRPGSYAPFRINRAPISLRGAAVQAGVTTGAFFLYP